MSHPSHAYFSESEEPEVDQMIKYDNKMIPSSSQTVAIDQEHQQLLNRMTRPRERQTLSGGFSQLPQRSSWVTGDRSHGNLSGR